MSDSCQRLPTGWFTHDRVDVPNPLAEAPERPERLDTIENNLIALGLDDRVMRAECEAAPMEAVLLAHDADYIERLRLASAGDVQALATFSQPDTQVGPETFDCAMKSAGAVTTAVDALMARRIRNAFCAVRPPGHHAARSEARGFCYINNVAVGALWAVHRHGIKRVAIVDFDAHHCDGTEEILAESPAVKLLNLYQWPLYPNRRLEPAPANAVMTPLPAGADGSDLERVLETVWLPALDSWRPELILLSAGFDAHAEEQMAQLKMKEVDYARLTRRLLDAADVVCEGRVVSVLEGGYSVHSLARSAMTHVNMLVMRGLHTAAG